MNTLGLKSFVKTAKFGKKRVEELVGEKGAIFSLISEGYVFDDEVLAAAHISKTASKAKVGLSVADKIKEKGEALPKDKSSLKQILSEVNTIENTKDDDEEDDTEDENDETLDYYDEE